LSATRTVSSAACEETSFVAQISLGAIRDAATRIALLATKDSPLTEAHWPKAGLSILALPSGVQLRLEGFFIRQKLNNRSVVLTNQFATVPVAIHC
jgi:hypothetical protein